MTKFNQIFCISFIVIKKIFIYSDITLLFLRVKLKISIVKIKLLITFYLKDCLTNLNRSKYIRYNERRFFYRFLLKFLNLFICAIQKNYL